MRISLDVDLSFSARLWEGEALQAEKTGQWSLLCVEEQILPNTETASGTLLRTGRWSLCASR